MLLYIEQNCAVREVTMAWVLGENKIYRTWHSFSQESASKRKFLPKLFSTPLKSRNNLFDNVCCNRSYEKYRQVFVPCGLQKDKSCQIFGVCWLLIVVNRTYCGTTVRRGAFKNYKLGAGVNSGLELFAFGIQLLHSTLARMVRYWREEDLDSFTLQGLQMHFIS